MNLLDQIAETENFTNTDREIARFILNHRDEIIHLSVTDVADRSYTSPGAVTRFCKRLNLNGYREFKVRFVQDLEKLTSSVEAVDADTPFLTRHNESEIMHNIAQLTRNTVDSCYAAIPADTMKRTAEYLYHADKVYLFGAGDSEISAISFANRLLKACKFAFIAEQYNEKDKYMNLMNSDDLVIVISYSGRSVPDKKTLYQMRQKGVKIVLISSKTVSGFDEIIPIPKKEAYEYEAKITTFYSQTAIQYILNCLYSMLINLQQNEQNRKRIRKSVYNF